MEVGAGTISPYSTEVLVEGRCQGMVRARSGKATKLRLYHHLWGRGSSGPEGSWSGTAGEPCTWAVTPACWGCFVFCQVVPVLRARLGSCLRLGTVCYSGTTKVSAKSVLSRGIGKRHGWELGKRNREHTGPEDK